ncbi:uncharacterized protein BDR25DRAFT_317305 [Lindgomyces ingoldianus]|uniref:Uncharacterized protein n=1 Tax=Lindgomyces ingoldianus TaxID=673940 RepID=A0ACB6QJN8_9PLEO|nr:uncharacterized protein BDR25DRAFT_317305 [Lindgomyces ingoldianus]KAF2467087.1 hypothetical protein BDR25DRAFT_317305 [Lindgomyces ingoldianus]
MTIAARPTPMITAAGRHSRAGHRLVQRTSPCPLPAGANKQRKPAKGENLGKCGWTAGWGREDNVDVRRGAGRARNVHSGNRRAGFESTEHSSYPALSAAARIIYLLLLLRPLQAPIRPDETRRGSGAAVRECSYRVDDGGPAASPPPAEAVLPQTLARGSKRERECVSSEELGLAGVLLLSMPRSLAQVVELVDQPCRSAGPPLGVKACTRQRMKRAGIRTNTARVACAFARLFAAAIMAAGEGRSPKERCQIRRSHRPQQHRSALPVGVERNFLHPAPAPAPAAAAAASAAAAAPCSLLCCIVLSSPGQYLAAGASQPDHRRCVLSRLRPPTSSNRHKPPSPTIDR